MLSISKQSNSNYLAKVVKLNQLVKHPNADRLQMATIDFQNVITGLDAKENDLYIYFPLECQINEDFLAHTNSYRKKLELNKEKEKEGFFESNGRVRAVKLRGEKSMGYIVPVLTLNEFFNRNIPWGDNINKEFDTYDDVLMLKKYIVKTKENNNIKKGKKPKISRLVDGQVHFHVSTEHLKRNAYKINPDDEITIGYKIHGTSFWVGNIIVKRNVNIFYKILRSIGIKIQDKEYDIVYGSRRVVKNDAMQDPKRKDHFYGYDLWKEIADELKEFIPKGFTLYGECAGHLKTGSNIQGEYDYGCNEGERKLYIYRITFTNEDGIVNNLSTDQIIEFCTHFGINTVPIMYQGKAKDLFKIKNDDKWIEKFIISLEEKYTEKDCYICANKVPEEGIVLRKEKMFQFEPFKLKSFSFLEYESKLLDDGEINLEDNQ